MRDGGRVARAVSAAWILVVACALVYTRFWEWPRLTTVDPIDIMTESGSLAMLAMAFISTIVLARLGAGEVFPEWEALSLVTAAVLAGLVVDLLDEFYAVPGPLRAYGEAVSIVLGAFLTVGLMKEWYRLYPEPPGDRWILRGVAAMLALYGVALLASVVLGGSAVRQPNPEEARIWAAYTAISAGLVAALFAYSRDAIGYVPIQFVVGGSLLLLLTPISHLVEAYLGWISPAAAIIGRSAAPTAYYASLYMALVEAFRRAACPQALRIPKLYEAVSLLKVRPSAESWPSAVNAIRRLAESLRVPVVLLTRPGSPLFAIADREGLPRVSILMKPGASFRRLGETAYEVPLEPAFIEGVLREILRGQEKGALVVFDSITDAIALLDRKRAYELVRRLSDLIRERESSGVFLVVPEAHDAQTRALIEKMFERSSEV